MPVAAAAESCGAAFTRAGKRLTSQALAVSMRGSRPASERPLMLAGAGRGLGRHQGSERSAAWLAHQSGGLGVGSSNLPAPTNEINSLAEIPNFSGTFL